MKTPGKTETFETETKVVTLKTESSETETFLVSFRNENAVRTQPEVKWFHWTKWPCWRFFHVDSIIVTHAFFVNFTWNLLSLHTPPLLTARFRSHVDAAKRCFTKTKSLRFRLTAFSRKRRHSLHKNVST